MTIQDRKNVGLVAEIRIELQISATHIQSSEFMSNWLQLARTFQADHQRHVYSRDQTERKKNRAVLWKLKNMKPQTTEWRQRKTLSRLSGSQRKPSRELLGKMVNLPSCEWFTVEDSVNV